MGWLSNQFENHRLFRRLFIIFCCVLVWVTTQWSFSYASTSELPGMELAAVLTAIQAPITMLVGFCAKLYTGSVDKK